MKVQVASALVPYVAAFALSALASGAVAVWVYRRGDARGSAELAATLAVVALWSVNSLLRVVVVAPRLTPVLLASELTLGVATAVLFFAFGATYTDRWGRYGHLVRAALVGLVAVTSLVAATNPVHEFVWPVVHPETTAGVTTTVVVKGPGHYLFTVAGYLAGLVGIYYLVVALWRSPRTRPALLSLVAGAVLMFSANLLPYLFDGILVAHPTTIAPLGATFAAIGVVVAVRYDLFGVVVVARSTVVETLSDPMVVLDDERRMLDANAAFREQFGDFPAGRDFGTALPAVAAQLDLADADDPQTVHLGDAADDSHFSVTVSHLEGGARRLGSSLVFRDVSELTKTARRLQRQNELLDEIAYSAAHNLRNPLGVIGGYAELLEAHLGDAEGEFDRQLVENCLRKVSGNVERMDEIIVDLLRVTHATKSSEGREWLAFGDVARTAFEAVDDDRLTLSVVRDGRVRGDYERLRTLFRTAFRATSDRAEGPATVRVELTADGFLLEDTAVPIDPQDAEVFLSYGYTTKYPGTGLGLAVARVLASGSGWSIRIDTDYTEGLRVVVAGAATDLDAARETPPPERA